jgi:FKBP-type peptidyl-prolyl cis-trans isomerase 2
MNHRAILEVTMRFHARFLSLFAAAVIAIAPLDGLRAEEKLPSKRSADEAHTVVEKGRKVSVEYTLTLDGGEVADTNVGKAPLTYEQGGGTMLPAFEAQIAGLGAGAKKEFDLAPEQGYGPVRKDLYHTVAAEEVPAEARKVGTTLVAQGEDGQQRPVRVHKIDGDKIVLDLNHPLAGKQLHFAVKVLSIE